MAERFNKEARRTCLESGLYATCLEMLEQIDYDNREIPEHIIKLANKGWTPWLIAMIGAGARSR